MEEALRQPLRRTGDRDAEPVDRLNSCFWAAGDLICVEEKATNVSSSSALKSDQGEILKQALYLNCLY